MQLFDLKLKFLTYRYNLLNVKWSNFEEKANKHDHLLLLLFIIIITIVITVLRYQILYATALECSMLPSKMCYALSSVSGHFYPTIHKAQEHRNDCNFHIRCQIYRSLCCQMSFDVLRSIRAQLFLYWKVLECSHFCADEKVSMTLTELL